MVHEQDPAFHAALLLQFRLSALRRCPARTMPQRAWSLPPGSRPGRPSPRCRGRCRNDAPQTQHLRQRLHHRAQASGRARGRRGPRPRHRQARTVRRSRLSSPTARVAARSRSAGRVIDVAQVAVLRPARVGEASVVPCRTVAPYDGPVPAGARPDRSTWIRRSDARIGFERPDDLVEPARQHLRVVVEEQRMRPAPGPRSRYGCGRNRGSRHAARGARAGWGPARRRSRQWRHRRRPGSRTNNGSRARAAHRCTPG